MAAISPEHPALEGKRKDDGSWHPCRVSQSDDDAGIIMNFESFEEEDIILDREDAVARLRFRSLPLQNGDCHNIKEGECVLAMHTDQSRTLFFDAIIEKAYRVRHSNRVHCRCSFGIKWLNPDLEGKVLTVPSNSIMKLSEKSITSDSVLEPYLNSLHPTSNVEGPPFCSLWEENDLDLGLRGLVEKIEEACLSDILLDAKQDKASGFAHNQNNRRTTRSRIKQEAKVEPEKKSEEKLFLSPLAYRAALASFMHERECEENMSLYLRDMKSQRPFDVSDVGVQLDASMQVNSKVLNPAQNEDIDSPMDAIHTSRSSRRRGSSKKSQCKDVKEGSSSVSRTAEGKCASSTSKNTRKPAADRELIDQPITARKTSSTAQKEIVDSTAEVDQVFTNEKNNSPVSTRLTSKDKLVSSTPCLGKTRRLEDLQDLGSEGKLCSSTILEDTRNSLPRNKVNGHTITTKATRSAVQRERLDSTAVHSIRKKKTCNLVTDRELKKVQLTECPHDQGMEDEHQSPTIVEPVIDDKLKKHAITSRITRSTVQRELLDSTVEVARGSSNKKLSEVSRDISAEFLDTPQKGESKKKSISSPVNSDTVVAHDKKKRARSSGAKATTDGDQGEILQNGNSSLAEKRREISPKQSGSRFSSRLRSLPRTRSQTSSPT